MKPKKLISPPKKEEYRHKEGQKDILIGLFSDMMAGGGLTQEQEYDRTEDDFKENLSEFNLTFIRDLFPHNLNNRSVDIYVFDFGGMMPGCDGLIESNYRELIKQIEDHPNMLVVLWGTLDDGWYENEIHKMFGENKDFPNVLFHWKSEYDEIFEKIKEWIT